MSKSRVAFVTTSTIVIIVILLGFFVFGWQSEEQSPLKQAQGTETSLDLGITYLPVAPGVAAYYGLGVDSGALVTEVTPHSSADKAGVKVGDVILTFNGVEVEETVPLLKMMRTCSAGSRIALEIWREKNVRIIELVHTNE